jgi:hypothetical protein
MEGKEMKNSVAFYILTTFLLLFIYNVSLCNQIDSIFSQSTLLEVNENESYKLLNVINASTTKDYRIVKINKYKFNALIYFDLIEDDNFIGKLIPIGENAYRIITEDNTIIGSLIIKSGKIRGYIQFKNEKYEIKPVDTKNHILILIDQLSVPNEMCNLHNDSTIIHENNSNNLVPASIETECNIRVLVSYTPSALDFLGSEEDINEDIQLAVLLTNESYINSGVNQRIELVRTCLTNYNESFQFQNARLRFGGTTSFPLDLLRLQNDQDGFMDELNQLRDIYSADIVVLIVNGYDFCGVARDIMSLEDGAFCLINAEGTCLTSNFSFAHELGHLMGSRHNPEADNNNVPFAYGHGFCYPQGNWRTIMSYNYNCGTRLQFWSNPDVLFLNIPMGTQQTHNNARVLNETEDLVKEFRITPTNYSIPAETIAEFNIADLLARSVLFNSTSYIASSNSQVTFRAGDEIILNPGFHSENGSNFHAFIESCGDNNFARSNSITEDLSSKTQNSLINPLTIQPNPFDDVTRISVNLTEPSEIRLEVFDLLGNRVAIITSGEQFPIGSHDFTFPGHQHNTGVYYLKLTTNKEHISRQLLLIK